VPKGASGEAPDAHEALATLETSLLHGDISKQTHDTISKQLDDPKISQRKLDDPKVAPNIAAITGLILGSPEFQRR
jgi:signal recognition particle GTPase